MTRLQGMTSALRSGFSIYMRELLSFFVSPIAYIILLVFLAVNGAMFYVYLRLSMGNLEVLLTNQYGGIPFWFLMLLIPPLLTMRTFAEEHRSGTYEALITTGVSEGVLVVAKFLASWTFFVVLWLAFLPAFVMLESIPDVNLDWGMIAAVHCGLLLLGALFSAIGVFASSFTRNQMVAAAIAIVINLLVFYLYQFRFFFEAGDAQLRIVQYVSPYSHFREDFSSGRFDFRYVPLYLSLSALFLFGGVKALERRRWW